MGRIARRLPVLAALALLAATPALASAGSPSYYVPKHAKAPCRSGYVKRTVKVTVRRHRRKVTHKQVRCVRRGSGGAPAPSFGNLPTATVTPTIVPTAAAHTYSTAAGQTLHIGAPGVLAGATGRGLTAQLAAGAASGSLSLGKDGSLTYVPAPDASGVVRFSYRVTDLNSTTSSVATVTIDVTPTVENAVYLVNSGQTLSVPAATLLGGAAGTGLVPSLVSSTTHGTLTLDSTGMTYTPNGAFAGADSFTYRVLDSSGLASGTATVTIDVNSVAPSVVPQAFSRAVGNTPLQVGGTQNGGLQVYQAASGPLLAGDSDPNGGGALTVTPESVATTLGGSVTVAGDGSFTYTPPAGFDGPGADSFTYQVDTTEQTSATATATIAFTRVHVWYVNSAVTTTGTGTASSPFKTFAEAAAASRVGDDIYLLTGTGDYPGPLNVPSGVAVVGQGSVLTIGSEQVTLAGSAPSVTNGSASNGGGVGISIGGDGSVTGVTVHDTAGDGVLVTGTGNVTLDAMTITSSAGDGIDATGPTLLAVTNSTIANSGSDGVLFAGPNSAQTLAVSNDTISGQPGAAVAATGLDSDAQVQVLDSTLGSSAGDGVDVVDGAGQLIVEAYGNTITANAATGILVNGAATSELDVTLDNPKTVSPNTITAVTGVTVTGSATASCLNAASNSITSTGSGNVALALDTGAGTFSVFNGTTPLDAYLASANTLVVNPPGGASVSLAATTGAFTTTSVACQVPQDLHLQ
jgi:hypothetical protein